LLGLTKCAAHLGKRAAQLAKRARIWPNASAIYQTLRIWPNAQIGQMRLTVTTSSTWTIILATVQGSVVRYLDTYRRYLRDDTSIAKVTIYHGTSIASIDDSVQLVPLSNMHAASL